MSLAPLPGWPATDPGAGFLVPLPGGAPRAVPPGFAAPEVLVLHPRVGETVA